MKTLMPTTPYAAPSNDSGPTGNELLALCADPGDRQAWDEFLRRFHPLIVTTVRRTVQRFTYAHPELCDDLAQQVYLKLVANDGRLLREFVPTHPTAAFGFIKVITANVVRDHFKTTHSRSAEPLPFDPPAPRNDDYSIVSREIDDFLRGAARENDRQIFWLYYRQGMTAKEIAAIPALSFSAKGVESVLLRLRQLIRQQFLGAEEAASQPSRRGCQHRRPVTRERIGRERRRASSSGI